MTVHIFSSFALECSDIAFDTTYLRQVTGPTFQSYLFCDRWVYILMSTFTFTGLAKLCITIVLSKSTVNLDYYYEWTEFKVREVHVVFSFLLEGKGLID